MTFHRFLPALIALPLVLAACDSGSTGDYAVEVASIEEVILDERGLPGLAFDVRNTGALPLHFLTVTVSLEPQFSEEFDVEHEVQRTVPLAPGGSDLFEVPLPSRASHDAYDCYRYAITGSDGAEAPAGESRPLALSERFGGTCG